MCCTHYIYVCVCMYCTCVGIQDKISLNEHFDDAGWNNFWEFESLADQSGKKLKWKLKYKLKE